MNNIFPMQSDHPLFRYFTEEERAQVERISELQKVRPNTEFIRAGDSGGTLYAIEDGHFDIVAKRDGRDLTVATLGPGDVIGEVSFIDDSPRTVSVVAGEEEVTVRAWDRRTLSEALAFEPQLLAKFAVAMSELLVERLRDNARRV